MQTKNGHVSEHTTYPAGKMIPVELFRPSGRGRLIEMGIDPDTVWGISPWSRRLLKKIHKRRSRRFLKRVEYDGQ